MKTIIISLALLIATSVGYQAKAQNTFYLDMGYKNLDYDCTRTRSDRQSR
jgi:hypothetical protein